MAGAVDTVGLAGAAALVGLEYDYLQRHWRAMVQGEGFPAPFHGVRKGQRPRWLVAALVAWMEARSAGQITPLRVVAPPQPARPANAPAAEQPRHSADRVSALLAAAGGQ